MKRTTRARIRRDDELNDAIEQAFYLKAVGGWEQREEKTVTEEDGKGASKEKKEVTLKCVPPDLDAILAWLRERAPERWRGGGDARRGDAGVIRVISSMPRPDGEA